MAPLSALEAGLIGTAVGTGLTTVSNALLAAFKARADAKLEMARQAGQMKQAAQSALRTQLQETHGSLLETTHLLLDPESDEEQRVFVGNEEAWEAEELLRSKIETIRLLADATTVRAAELMVAALMRYLRLLEVTLEEMKNGEDARVLNIAIATERMKVERARKHYIHCAQVDLGLTEMDKEVRKSVTEANNPYEYHIIKGPSQSYLVDLARKRLAYARSSLKEPDSK